MCMTVNFSSEATEARMKWHSNFQVPREKNCILKIQYLVKLSFRKKGEIKTFSDKGQLKKIVISEHILQDWLKRFLQTKRK